MPDAEAQLRASRKNSVASSAKDTSMTAKIEVALAVEVRRTWNKKGMSVGQVVPASAAIVNNNYMTPGRSGVAREEFSSQNKHSELNTDFGLKLLRQHIIAAPAADCYGDHQPSGGTRSSRVIIMHTGAGQWIVRS